MIKYYLFTLFFILSAPAWAKKYDPPKLSVVEAIEMAKTYVSINNIAIKDRSFISEVMYKHIYNEYETAYWSVKWHMVPRVKGGWFEMRIYNNGKSVPKYGK